jgi:hypothetical protein
MNDQCKEIKPVEKDEADDDLVDLGTVKDETRGGVDGKVWDGGIGRWG